RSKGQRPISMRRMRLTAAVALAFAIALSLTAGGQQPSPPGAARAGIQAAPEDPTWNRRTSGGGDYATVMEVSGREEVFRFMERPENPEDLRAICLAKRQAATSAIGATEKYLASLTALSAAKQDVREIIWTRKS